MKALFLDRDGIINKRLVDEYVRSPQEFEFIPDVLPIVAIAQDHGFLCILISNQQGVGKGLMTDVDLDAVTEHMQQTLESAGVRRLDAVYYCTDLASSNSPNRKPAPGMLLQAIDAYGIDAHSSWFLGDSITDAEAGKAAGVRTALVGEFAPGTADIVTSTLSEMFFQLKRNIG
ncbi:MAG: HAD family hydrolase [Bradyrhizobiaceae bacterium]|nr:HAD family hydrolase [Bradyrhizobiaceae bacterium]